MELRDVLVTKLAKQKQIMLGLGPMSVNCVKAAVQAGSITGAPIFLIASRRQIECAAQGGGYVNNWSTEKFSNFVQSIPGFNPQEHILARDHGGPWQSTYDFDNAVSLADAMKSARKSLEIDIESGFKVLHIDPSLVPPGFSLSQSEIYERLFELYLHCLEYADKINKSILIEIGTEEQVSEINQQDRVFQDLDVMDEFCLKHSVPKPLFVVIQTGTKVLETKNVGILEDTRGVANYEVIEQVRAICRKCNERDYFVKEHNGDYLSSSTMKLHKDMGINAVNIAPQYGVIETREILKLLKRYLGSREVQQFSEAVLSSQKWKKWMLPETLASEADKVEIAGHYNFSNPLVTDVLTLLDGKMERAGVDLTTHLVNKISDIMVSHIRDFNTHLPDINSRG